MNKNQLSVGSVLLLAGILVVAGAWRHAERQGTTAANQVLLAAAIVVLASGALVTAAARVRPERSRAVLRLDHFLPFLRKKKQKETPAPPGLLLRLARRMFPATWLSDPISGKPGRIRKLLKWLGPSVLSSPMRRVVQAVCLLLFLYLFFYVCWPYSSQPVPAGAVSPGWTLEDIDQQTGNLRMAGGRRLDSGSIAPGNTVHVIDERASHEIRGDLGEFAVVEVSDQRIELASRGRLSEETLDLLLTSLGTWSLRETSPWASHYADDLERKQWLPAEFFLVIDPLVSLSTAVAARSWVWSLACAAIILIVCVLIPRGFCGYLCPLGTLIDVFDWTIGKRVTRFRVADDGWWVHIKYYLLAGMMICAALGILVSGYVAAIPVITRGLLFLGDPLQSGLMRGFGQLPAMNAGHLVSIAMFLAVLGLGLLKPRFWCKYVCPSGAVFSLGNLFRVSERKVESSCIHCNKCVEICPFDAIKPDFTTRTSDCTLCQTCAGVCPTQAIKFVERWNLVDLKVDNDPPTLETAIGRRGFVSLAAGTAAAVVGGLGVTAVTRVFGAGLDDESKLLPIRPPGSVPEQQFLQMCIRCGECFKVCPYNVLQPLGFDQGLEGLWTPRVVADHAGCAPSCNACGQVCPTGAIRDLVLEEKRVARMGLAILNQQTCLPIAGREACQLCVDECNAAGYFAIDFTRMHTEVDDAGQPIEDSGFLAPVVAADRCVGCGLCQMSCYRVNVDQKGLLGQSAIVIEAGDGKEDRLMYGSYRELRRQEQRQRRARQQSSPNSGRYFVPGQNDPAADDPFGAAATPAANAADDPFGTAPQVPAPTLPESVDDPF
jgi:ferredoxin